MVDGAFASIQIRWFGFKSSDPRGHYVVFLGKTLSRNTPSRFMLQKPGLAPALWVTSLVCRLYLYSSLTALFFHAVKSEKFHRARGIKIR